MTLAYQIWQICLSPWENVSRSWYNLELWSQCQIYRVYDCFVFRTRLFCLLTLSYFVWHVSVSPWYNVSRTFMSLTFDLNIKIIFSPWVWQNVFALWHRHTKFWQMGVSPWDNMLCTFFTLVWPWPLTYMWVAGVSLVSFTHSFYLVDFYTHDHFHPKSNFM